MHAPPADSFTFEPLFIVLAIASAMLYLRHVRTAGSGRRVLFGVGLACIVCHSTRRSRRSRCITY